MNIIIVKEELMLKAHNSTEIKIPDKQYKYNHTTTEKLADSLNLFIAKINFTI